MNKIKLTQDTDIQNPRMDYTFGKMISFHGRYNLGDPNHGFNQNNYDGWESLKKGILSENKNAVILPLYLYDHSGITIATKPFHCKWDSGQIGYIFISLEDVRNEFSVKRVTKKLREKIISLLEGEVNIYDMYLRGDVYSYEIVDQDDNTLDSCSGFYGGNINENGMLEHISREDYFPELNEEEFQKMLKELEVEY